MISRWMGRRQEGSLRMRVLLLITVVFVAVSGPAYLAFNWMVDTAIIKLGTLFAEKQVLFDRYRGMEALAREASLAATLARSPAIREWATDERDADKTTRGLAELEHYRQAFTDKSYFFVIAASGNYYFNDRSNTYAGSEKRYTIDRNNPRDGWYDKTIAASRDCQLNVDHDDNLRVTKVWINCPVVDGGNGAVLGVAGTGIDLSSFIREVVDIPQVGVNSMFVDHSGAIQAHRDANMVDFHSLTKDPKSKSTIFALLDKASDRDALAEMMRKAANGGKVDARFVTMGGHQYLAGVGYLNNLGWFNVSLMDIDRIIERRLFMPIALLLAAMLLLAAGLVTVLFKRVVLDRLAQLEASVRAFGAGNYAVPEADQGSDEIGRLSRTFAGMSAAVGDNAQFLEALVKERTVQLERLAEIDPLTEVHNRRGFIPAVERERNRATRRNTMLGLLLIDLDLLKTVNDSYGHAVGDLVLKEVARRLRQGVRSYDTCARWGGDEFAVLISDCTMNSLAAIANKALAAINREPVRVDDDVTVWVTVSIGACLALPQQSLDAMTAQADTALYLAKDAGRNRVIVHDVTWEQSRPA